jgi:hypothetical protein
MEPEGSERCLRMYRSLNSWCPSPYLGLGEWSLKDSEQLLEDVLLSQQLLAVTQHRAVDPRRFDL